MSRNCLEACAFTGIYTWALAFTVPPFRGGSIRPADVIRSISLKESFRLRELPQFHLLHLFETDNNRLMADERTPTGDGLTA